VNDVVMFSGEMRILASGRAIFLRIVIGFAALLLMTATTYAIDSDSDGLDDSVETGTGVYVSPADTGTDPNNPDTDGDGLSDTVEKCMVGIEDPLWLRVGDAFKLDFTRLGINGTMKLVGKPPTGLTFNAKTGILEGKVAGKPGTYLLSLQYLNGKTVVRDIPLPLTVAPFPVGFAGSFQGLLRDHDGHPQGLLSVTVSAPGAWTGTLDLAGSSKILSAKGSISLNPSSESLVLLLPFASGNTLTLHFDPHSALISGTYPHGTIAGFRLARGAELPKKASKLTMGIGNGLSDGFTAPAGYGWATGSISTTGTISLTGQLGDSKAFKIAPRLSATGQAIIWLKPYRNSSSSVGGIVSLRYSGLAPEAPVLTDGEFPDELNDGFVYWSRVPDATEVSYPSGFDMITWILVRPFTQSVSASALAVSQGLTRRTFTDIEIHGAGLPDNNSSRVFPTSFTIDDRFNLLAQPLPDTLMVPWKGSILNADGSFKGAFTLSASSLGIASGQAIVSGILPGLGLAKIPLSSPKGGFRTASIGNDLVAYTVVECEIKAAEETAPYASNYSGSYTGSKSGSGKSEEWNSPLDPPISGNSGGAGDGGGSPNPQPPVITPTPTTDVNPR
jgi:hypothetical protein